MKKRVISAAVLLAIIIPLIIIGKIPFALAVGVIGVFAYKEIMDLNKYPLMVKVLGIISLISIVYSNFDSKMINFGLDFKIISISFLLLFIPVIFYQVNNKYTVDDAFRLFGFLFLIGVSLNYFIIIRDMDLKYFILMLLTPILTDTFAYIGGSLNKALSSAGYENHGETTITTCSSFSEICFVKILSCPMSVNAFMLFSFPVFMFVIFFGLGSDFLYALAGFSFVNI